MRPAKQRSGIRRKRRKKKKKLRSSVIGETDVVKPAVKLPCCVSWLSIPFPLMNVYQKAGAVQPLQIFKPRIGT